jgi:hypothetical protein
VSPTWTVLVPTLGQRRDLLRRLLDGLMPQVEIHGGVKVLAYWDNGQVGIGAKKQALLDATDTDYLCFVDDDDTVSDDYVSAIAEALESEPDQVGLKMQVYENGRSWRLSHHSLRHGGWINDGAPYFRRDITCANPIRTRIAQTARFDIASDQPEDVTWVNQLRAGGLLQTEVFVDRVLYHYWWVPLQSAWTNPAVQIRRTAPDGQPWRPLAVDSPRFAWHPASPFPEE